MPSLSVSDLCPLGALKQIFSEEVTEWELMSGYLAISIAQRYFLIFPLFLGTILEVDFFLMFKEWVVYGTTFNLVDVFNNN